MRQILPSGLGVPSCLVAGLALRQTVSTGSQILQSGEILAGWPADETRHKIASLHAPSPLDIESTEAEGDRGYYEKDVFADDNDGHHQNAVQGLPEAAARGQGRGGHP